MRTLLLIYIIIYSIVWVGTLIVYFFALPAEERADDTTAEHVTDVFLLALGLAGMLFLYFDYGSEALRNTWKIVSIALILVQLVVHVRSRARFLSDDSEERQFVPLGDALILLFLVPSFGFNLAYAFKL